MSRAQENANLPFSIGEIAEPDWDRAILSVGKNLSSIDIPLKNNAIYQVGRASSSGYVNTVYTHSKLVAVKSLSTGESDIYAKIYILEDMSNYGDYDMYTNCGNRSN